MSQQHPVARSTSLTLHALAGVTLILAGVVFGEILGRPIEAGSWRAYIVAAGLVVFSAGLLPTRSHIGRLSLKFCLVVITTVFSIAMAEAAFRIVGVDLSGQVLAQQRVPPFFRQPTEPSGEVYFRRPGPDRWTGRVLFTFLQQSTVQPNPYSSEPVITAAYDEKGFRNPEPASNWTIAVAGDSFTELGHLPEEMLFTSVLSRELRTPVLNLGTSYTGPLTHLSYLRDYGIGPSVRHMLVVFFEGNDIDDLNRESEALHEWERSRQRSYREVKPDPSFARAVFHWVADKRWPGGRDPGRFVTGHFQSAAGPVPVTLVYTPPRAADIPAKTRAELASLLERYTALAARHQASAWLAYMPSKERALHGLVTFAPGASPQLKAWTPTDLPSLVEALCADAGVRFIDLSPALVEETRKRRRLLYSSIFDTHLNGEGARVVGDELARQFRRRAPGLDVSLH